MRQSKLRKINIQDLSSWLLKICRRKNQPANRHISLIFVFQLEFCRSTFWAIFYAFLLCIGDLSLMEILSFQRWLLRSQMQQSFLVFEWHRCPIFSVQGSLRLVLNLISTFSLSNTWFLLLLGAPPSITSWWASCTHLNINWLGEGHLFFPQDHFHSRLLLPSLPLHSLLGQITQSHCSSLAHDQCLLHTAVGMHLRYHV